MKIVLLSLAALCVIASFAEAQRHSQPTFSRRPMPKHFSGSFGAGRRFRREEPQGSVVLDARQPLSGPDRSPTLDLNYQHRLIDNDRTKVDAFGGANYHRGHVSPQVGAGFEHRFKNDIFVHGRGQVEQGPGGRLSPSFGAGLGWRFRREAQPYEEEEVVEDTY